jgi:ABC-2 type transport system ATP-binding protein
MLAGILPPTSGTGRVAGYDMLGERQQIKQAIGYMSQRFSLYEDLTVRENLQFFGGVYGARDLNWAVDVCRLRDVTEVLCGSLSAGLRQRAALACAVVHKPRIVFLDEPTAGVDPASRRSFWELIYSLSSESVTVFVSTHYMDEAEHCDWLAMIDAGRIVASGSPRSLRAESFHAHLLELDADEAYRWIEDLEALPGVSDVAMHGNKLHLTTDDAAGAEKAIRELGERMRLKITSILEITPSLEDVFVSVMTQRAKPSAGP